MRSDGIRQSILDGVWCELLIDKDPNVYACDLPRLKSTDHWSLGEPKQVAVVKSSAFGKYRRYRKTLISLAKSWEKKTGRRSRQAAFQFRFAPRQAALSGW